MSAFIVTNRTITQAIEALKLSQSFRYNGMYLDDPDHIKALGNELLALNAAAVAQRYDEPVEIHDYRFEWPTCNKYQALKSLDCLIYQCSEGDVPERPLYKVLKDCQHGLMYEIVASSSEYQAAKWNADDPTHEVQAIRIKTASNRPGDEAAAYAEETGIDYSTALRLCNMD